MRKFPELNRRELARFLQAFSQPGTLKFRDNKWIGLNRRGKPFTIHVKHGDTRKYSPSLVAAIAKNMEVTFEEFRDWLSHQDD